MNIQNLICSRAVMLTFALIGLSMGVVEVSHAEGSRTLFPAGYSGARGAIQVVPSGKFAGVANSRQFLYLYAQKDEYILLGSRNVGQGGNVRVYNPQPFGAKGDETLPTTANFSCSSQAPNGAIASRVQELAGPNSADGTATVTNGYAACWYQAPVTGIYGVYFTGASASSGSRNSVSNPGYHANEVTVWDVTVRNSASSLTDIDGRLFTYAYAVYTGSNGSSYRLYNDLFFVSGDGYRYQQTLHGLDPNRAAFYANSKGYIDTNGDALYHDMRGGNVYVTVGPSIVAGIVAQAPEYPLFFSDIDPNSAASADGVDKVLAALSIPLVATPPTLSSANFTGTLGGNHTTQSSGGTFTFTATNAQSFEIVISLDGVDFDPASGQNRVLTGTATNGANTVLWNGLDNNGNPFPGSIAGSDYNYRITSRNGEIHFPMVDIEGNIYGGPTLTKLNGSLGSTVYFDDRGYVAANGDPIGDLNGLLCGAPSLITPPSPSHSLLGVDSADANFGGSGKYYRFWTGSTDSNTDCKDVATEFFGTAKGLDLWAFEKSPVLEPEIIIFQQGANVDVTTSVSVPATIVAGGTVYGTFTFSNTSTVPATDVTYSVVIGSPGGWCPSAVTFTLQPFGNPTYNSATCEVSFDASMPTTLAGSQSLTFNFNYVAPTTAATIPVDTEIEASNEIPAPGVAPNTAHGETVVMLPEVTVSKASDPVSGSNVNPGNQIEYTLTAVVVDAPLTSVLSLTDTLSGTQTLVSGSASSSSFSYDMSGAPTLIFTLPSGTLPGTYTVSYQTTVDATATTGSVGNSVVVTQGGGDPDPVCDNCTTGHPITAPKLVIVKSASPTTFIVGQAASYTITVTNTGTAATTAVSTISDTIPAGLTIGTLPAGCSATGQALTCTISSGLAADTGTQSFTIPVTVTADATNGDNTAYVTGGGDPSCTDANCPSSVIVPITAPKLAIVKSASPTTFIVGQAASYTITVTNTGTAATTAVSTISDTIPTGLTIGTLPAGCSATGQALTCTIASGMATGTGSAVSFTVPVTVTADATNGDNTAYVTGGGDPACTDTSCPSNVTVPITAPKLAIVKSASPATFIVGEAASYTITVTNTGTAATTAVSTISDTIPAGLTIGTLPAGCSATGQALTCTIASGMATGAGSAVSFTVPVSVTSDATSGDNTAYVTGGGDPACTDTSCPADVTVPINTAVNITLEKAGPATALVNDDLVYTISLGNSGGTESGTTLTVADTLPAGVIFVSAAPGNNVSSLSCVGAPDLLCALTLIEPLAPDTGNGAASFAITAMAPDRAGSIINYASVDPTGGDEPPVPGTDCAPAASCGDATTTINTAIPDDVVAVPVDSRWFMILLSGLLLTVGLRRMARQRR